MLGIGFAHLCDDRDPHLCRACEGMGETGGDHVMGI